MNKLKKFWNTLKLHFQNKTLCTCSDDGNEVQPPAFSAKPPPNPHTGQVLSDVDPEEVDLPQLLNI